MAKSKKTYRGMKDKSLNYGRSYSWNRNIAFCPYCFKNHRVHSGPPLGRWMICPKAKVKMKVVAD